MAVTLTYDAGVHRISWLDNRTYPLVFVAIAGLGTLLITWGAFAWQSGGKGWDKVLPGVALMAYCVWGFIRIQMNELLIIQRTTLRCRKGLGYSTIPLHVISGFTVTGPERSSVGGHAQWTVSIIMNCTNGRSSAVLFGTTRESWYTPELLTSAQELAEALNRILGEYRTSNP